MDKQVLKCKLFDAYVELVRLQKGFYDGSNTPTQHNRSNKIGSILDDIYESFNLFEV